MARRSRVGYQDDVGHEQHSGPGVAIALESQHRMAEDDRGRKQAKESS